MLHCLGLAEKTRMQQMSNRRRHVCLHCRERGSAVQTTPPACFTNVHLFQKNERCTRDRHWPCVYIYHAFPSLSLSIYAYLFCGRKSSKPCRARLYDIRLVHVVCYDDVNVNLTEEETRGSTCPEI